MVWLPEYEAKSLLRGRGLRVPDGLVASTPEAARDAFMEFSCPVVVKAQIPVGGRGKAGAILPASNAEECFSSAKKLLGNTFKGEKVRQVLVEKKSDIGGEFYLSFSIDRFLRTPVLVTSKAGGIEVEKGRNFVKCEIDVRYGLQPFQARHASYGDKKLAQLLMALWDLFRDMDCELLEINPLSTSKEGEEPVALDAKIITNDDASFRHGGGDASEESFNFVKLDGDIGIVGNGAGLVMAVVDLVKMAGGNPANFCDLGGGADPETIRDAIMKTAGLKPGKILVAIFGGITRCDKVAEGIVEAGNVGIPIFVRMIGTNQEEGEKILAAKGIRPFRDLKTAVEAVVNDAA